MYKKSLDCFPSEQENLIFFSELFITIGINLLLS